MSKHFINKCSCGEIISQCRCPGTKEETIIEHGCDKCKEIAKASEATDEPRDGFVQCLESGTVLASAKKWEFDQPTEFQWMPGGITTINAHYNGKPIELTVQADQMTAKAVQASYEDWFKVRPKQTPFGCVEHREQEAAIRLPKDVAAFTWKDADGDADAGIYCTAVPTELGAKNVNGRIHSSWSPSFTTDAEYAKAKEVGGRMVFPAKARGSRDNPAKVTGVAFSVGSLTNKPAFRNINPVKATEEGPVEGKEQGEKEIDATWSDAAREAAIEARKNHKDASNRNYSQFNAHNASSAAFDATIKAHTEETAVAHREALGAHSYAGDLHQSMTGKSHEEAAAKHFKYVEHHLKQRQKCLGCKASESTTKEEVVVSESKTEKEETGKVDALASLYPNETLLDDLYKQVQASEKPIDKLYAELVGVADQTAGQS